jgi:hypothetical protein
MKKRYLKVEGPDYDRGRIIGKCLCDNILTILKAQENAEKHQDDLTLSGWLPHARTLFPFIRKHAPRTMEEIKGMANGSGQPVDRLLLLACSYENSTSFSRHAAMKSLLTTHSGSIDVQVGCQILSDHRGEPASICAHPHPGQSEFNSCKTIAAMVFDPAEGSMYIAFGNGCKTPYNTYSFS